MFGPRAHRILARVILPGLVGFGGAWLATAAFAHETVPVGPFRVELRAGFGRSVTDIELPPLGTLTADSHLSPIRLSATLRGVDVEGVRDALARESLEQLAAEMEAQAIDRVMPFTVEVLVIGMAGALIGGLLVFRNDRRRLWSALIAALLALGGSEALAAATYDTKAFLAPSYSGSLALAPSLFGPIESTVQRVGYFRTELERIVDAGSRAYAAVEANPLGRGDAVSVLHISDIHLSTLGYAFARQLADSFDVDFVIDTGDVTSFGTPAENLIAGAIPGFGKPYVFVRGSHDSLGLQAAIARIPNATVLDGTTTTIDGITVYGLGDPYFVQHRGEPLQTDAARAIAASAGPRVLADVHRLPRPPDVVAVHDDLMAESVAGRVPLVLSGHYHVDEARTIDGTLYLRVGTTGGAGPTGFTAEGNIPFSAEILYFRPTGSGGAPSLVAWDSIQQDQATGSLTIDRHLVEQEFGTLTPSPEAAATRAAAP